MVTFVCCMKLIFVLFDKKYAIFVKPFVHHHYLGVGCLGRPPQAEASLSNRALNKNECSYFTVGFLGYPLAGIYNTT